MNLDKITKHLIFKNWSWTESHIAYKYQPSAVQQLIRNQTIGWRIKKNLWAKIWVRKTIISPINFLGPLLDNNMTRSTHTDKQHDTQQHDTQCYLSLSNISSQIRNRMCDIVVRHSKDGYLCDTAVAPRDSPRALVDRRQISVHVTWETSSSGYLLSCCWHLQINFI